MKRDTARHKIGLFFGRHETEHSGLWKYSESIAMSMGKSIGKTGLSDGKFEANIVVFSSIPNLHPSKGLIHQYLPSFNKFRRLSILKDLFFKPKSYDLLHGTSNFLPLCKANEKRVITIHDLLQIFPNKALLAKNLNASHTRNFYISLRSVFYKLIYKRMLKTADLVLCNNNEIKSDLVNKLGVNKRIELVPHPLLKQFINAKNPKTLENKTYLLAFASKDPRKNINLLLQAFKQVSEQSAGKTNINLIIVSNSKEVTESLNEKLEAMKISASVKILSNVSDEKLLELYQGAKGLIFPSIAEGFGYPVYEALTQKCPVLLGNKSQILDVVPSVQKGLIEVNVLSIASIKEGIIKLIEFNEDLELESLEVQKKLDPDKISADIVKLYEEIL